MKESFKTIMVLAIFSTIVIIVMELVWGIRWSYYEIIYYVSFVLRLYTLWYF